MSDLGPGAYSDPSVVLAPASIQRHGAWLATLRFRALDGGEPERVVQAYGASRDAAEHSLLAKLDALRGTRVQTMGLDGPAARDLIEAAGHMHELRQAAMALDKAEETEDGDVARLLRAQAVTLYGRTFHSNVRRALSEFVPLSKPDAALNERLRALRNRHVAHSENTMTATSPLLNLRRADDGSIVIEGVPSITMESPMPHSFTTEFRALLGRLIELLASALEPLKEAVKAEVTPAQAAELFQRPELVQMLPVRVSEWAPEERRPRFPNSRFTPMHVLPDSNIAIQVTFNQQ